ncbi:MAG: molybdopterin converting factor subunit 1 [Ramlibacter sp.]
MKVQLRYFASVREAIGRGSEQRETAAATLSQLRDELAGQGEPYAQALAPGRAVRMALDQVMVQDDAQLQDGCEVAFFPPVTGG